MKIVKIISQHKRARGRMIENRFVPPQPIPHGMKRVMAIVEIQGEHVTRHLDVPLTT